MVNKKGVNYPYIKVKGVELQELDFYLVKMFSTSKLSKYILSDSYLSKNLPFNRVELISNSIQHDELVKEIVNNMENSYKVYNNMMRETIIDIQRFEDKIKKRKDYLNITNNSEKSAFLFNELCNELKNVSFTKNKLICWLRLKPNLHDKLLELIKHDGKNGDNDMNEIIKEEHLNEKQTFSDQIHMLKKIIISMEEQSNELENQKNDVLNSQVLSLKEELDQIRNEIVKKDKEIKSKNREIQKFQKKYDDEVNNRNRDKDLIKKLQKDLGEQGSKLGELRKELDKALTEKNFLEQNITQLTYRNGEIEEKIKVEYTNELNKQLALQKSRYEEKLDLLESSHESSLKMNEKLYADLKMKFDEIENDNNILQSQVSELKLQLIKKDEKTQNPINVNSKTANKEEESLDLTTLFGSNEFEPEFT
ncbi:coiled-coil domain-containing protein [Ureibacillus acetophenoni]|uniref:coiled-coil domain-containing protein n=1 Tax=Ureibacillus acetophenoni TaxID=614649 RepID=UPI000BE22474|nr:hypothetical protein [Ureibacillus acetophenoni]